MLMLAHRARLQAVAVPQRVARRAGLSCSRPVLQLPHQRSTVCRSTAPDQPPAHRASQRHPQNDSLPKLLASCGAIVGGLLGPLLPSWAMDSFDLDSFPTVDTSIEPGLGDSPPLLDTLLVVVITYFTVMLLYLWLSSFMDEGTPQDDNSKQGDQSELPPGYGTFLDAHVRTYVGRDSKQVQALQDLGQAAPLEGEDMNHLKNRLAAGAAEALELQLRDCERLVRSKLLARKLGYHPSHKQQQAPGSSSSNGSKPALDHQIEELMLAAVMTSPEGLGSWQQRAAVEALIDEQLDRVLPAGGGAFQEDLVVRQVMRRVVAALVMEESLLLLEGTNKATRMMQESKGRKGQAGTKPWALW